MDAKGRIAQLAADATAGLRDDAELRADVRAELASHIEEAAAAHEAAGRSPDEAVELAVKAFGPVAEVAAGLVEGNRRRMKRRALARLAVRALLVPAAVVATLVVCSRLVPLRGALAAIGFLGGGWCDGQAWSLDSVAPGLPEDKAFVLHGDAARPTDAERQRSIWEAQPQSRMWFGNYITHLVPEHQGAGSTAPLERVERELRRGEQLDPDNARYNVLLAGLWAERAVELQEERTETMPDDTKRPWHRLVVKDRARLDRAMAELLKGVGKPYYRTYSDDVLRERLGLVAPVRRFEEQIARIAWAAGILLPDCAVQRELARVAPLYGEMLVAEGRGAEGQRLLDAWYPLVQKYNDDAFTLIELLVGRAVVRLGEQYGAAAYERLGEAELAERTRRRAQRLARPFKGYLERRRAGASEAFERELLRSGSLLDGMLFPALDPEVLHEIDLAPSRQLEHVLVEQAGVSVYLVALVGLMALSAAAVVRWRWALGPSAAPMLLLPEWRTLARVLVVGVLLPLGLYYVYTRWSGAAGREFGLRYLGHRLLLELVLLGTTIGLLARSMATGAIRRRCEALGVEVPPRAARWRRVAVWVGVAALWGLCLATRTDRMLGGPWMRSPVVWGTGVVAAGGAVVLAVRFVYGRRGYGRYCATAARSLVPVFAAAALVLAAAAQPYLRASEVRLLRADSSLTSSSEFISFTRAEAMMVERLKAAVRQAADELAGGS